MQLRTARLCLDCEELHDAQQCPICASEAFASIARWVPAPERRRGARPTTSRDADIYRQLITPETEGQSSGARLLKQGALGLTAAGLVAAWFIRNAAPRVSRSAPQSGPEPKKTPGD